MLSLGIKGLKTTGLQRKSIKGDQENKMNGTIQEKKWEVCIFSKYDFLCV